MSIHKRGWTHDEKPDIDRRPLIIQSDPSNPFAKPRIFTPLCLLSRSQLPLAYLDTTHSGSRLFHAHVKILETCYEVREGASVLVVQDGAEGRLYAIERVQARRYALCRLASWVCHDHILERTAVRMCDDEASRKRRSTLKLGEGRPWWSSISVELPEIDNNDTSSATPTLCMRTDDSSNVQKDVNLMMDTTQTPNLDKPALAPDQHQDVDAPTSLSLSASEMFAELSRQYLDALYVSRTSLAFFSKGPLSRTRAAFSGDSNVAFQPAELLDFLRSMLLTSATMDKKYRESIADAVQDLSAEPTLNHKRKKRKWKAKRDKSGFFSDEKDYIEAWWRKCDETSNVTSSTETLQTLLKQRTPRLRNREGFLQVILMLEILALEKSASTPNCNQSVAEPNGAERDHVQSIKSEVPSKRPHKKKSVETGDLLDNLLDRVTIWHSLDNVAKADQPELGKEDASDELKDFCTEVVLPFYMSRVSEYVIMVNKKFGGPDLLTPNKRKHSSSSRKPGQPATRHIPVKRSRRPLERVATDSLSRPSHPPLLTRAATDSDALIKREPSDTTVLLRNIPTSKSRSGRVGGVQAIALNRREVDLSALHHANEEKMRKKAEIQEKLVEAIGAIKKPQRSIRDVAEQTDESFAKALSKAKSYGNRKTSERTNHVTATPSHIKATPSHRRMQPLRSHTSDSIDIPTIPASITKPSSSMLAIPQTGHRQRVGSPSILLESPSMARTASIAIMETPIKQLRIPVPDSTSKVASQTPGKDSKSIYDMWNDENYEELV